jgi:hypothetical protein
MNQSPSSRNQGTYVQVNGLRMYYESYGEGIPVILLHGGLETWKKETNYHRRSLAETAMFRLKTIFGPKLHSRSFENQCSEACRIPTRFRPKPNQFF